jgi:hypothetical protein
MLAHPSLPASLSYILRVQGYFYLDLSTGSVAENAIYVSQHILALL